MKSHKAKVFPFVLMAILMAHNGCQSDYTHLVKRELQRKVKKDSLIFGLKMGDTKRQFFKRCWELNRKGLVSQGPNNRSVQYRLPSEGLSQGNSPIVMLFYVTTDDHNLVDGMDMTFSYSAWAPWNRQLYADRLMPVVLDTLSHWFPGNPFIEVNSRTRGEIMVKVDANRQIQVYRSDNKKDVNVKIEDLNRKYNALDL